jgi:hypothetical protein
MTTRRYTSTPAYKDWVNRIFTAQGRNLDTFFDQVTGYNSHFTSKHVAMRTSDLFDRVITEGHSASGFATTNDMKSLLADTICSESEALYTQLHMIKNHDVFTVFMNFRDEIYNDPEDPVDFTTHQKGLLMLDHSRIIEMDTTVMKAVIQKDDNAEYGFTVLTAYPDIECEEAVPTGRDLTKDLTKSRAYQNARPLTQAFLDHAIKKDPVCTMKLSNFESPTLTAFVYARNPGITHRIYMSPDEPTTIKTVRQTNDGKETIVGKYAELQSRISGHPTTRAYLNNHDIRQAFAEDNPAAEAEIAETEKNIKDHTVQRQQRNAKRMAYDGPINSPQANEKQDNPEY